MSTTVRDNAAASRYEILSDGEPAGFLAYDLAGDRIVLNHAEVDPAYAGRGLGRQLVVVALDDAAERGLAVVPVCSYVRKVIADEAERYLHLVPEQMRGSLRRPGPVGSHPADA